MKQWEKDILERQMKNESVAVWQLEKVYNKAHQDSLEKLAMLKGMEPTPSVVRQVAFQEEITKQLSTVYDDLYKKSYTTVQGFLDTGAEDAFFGALYSMNKQGIPMAFPLPTEEIAQITRINPTTGFKLSEKLYANTTQLGRKVKEEISRGLATDLSYQEMARNLKNASEANYKQAVRITRTEGHRVNGEVSFMAMDKAKKAGADIVKQWDSTLDKRTRKSHVEMDGQIRELDEKFVSGNGKKTMWQGGFGVANEDIHCRCVVLQRARWMLEDDGEPPTKWDGVNKELIELKEQDYDGFKKAVKKLKKSPPIVPPVVPPIPDVPDIDEPPASTLKDKIDALRNTDANYTKEQLMEAGDIVLKDIQNVPEIKAHMKKVDELLEKQKSTYAELNVHKEAYLEAKRANFKTEMKIRKMRDDGEIDLDKMVELINENNDVLNGYINNYNANRTVWQNAVVDYNNYRKTSFYQMAEFTKAKIGEIRGVGGISSETLSSHLNDSRSAMKKIVMDAYDVYPTDWIQKSIDRGNLTPKAVKRGYYSEFDRVIALSGEGNAQTYGTAIHELGHRFEMAVPEIRKAEKEFYEYRTDGEKLVWMGEGYKRSEKTRVDNFINKYIGKDYVGQAYELVSMGFQYAFTEPETLFKDEEYAKWIYGILTMY